ncbi:uncharacterized protein LOC113681802, partial [Pocillopora damicornis]|uniref:uncharacterized protein LOC113681802 n=1 Tax=Pocillopora damicornis TaxID=46731 RepID=UPI000F5555D9
NMIKGGFARKNAPPRENKQKADAERCTQKMMCFAQRRNQPSHWSRLAKTVGIEAMQLRKTMYNKTEFNEWIHDRNESAPRSSSMKKSRTWRNPMMIEHG